MASKKIYLYRYDVLNKKISCKRNNLEKIIKTMFDDNNNNVTKFENGNRTLILEEGEDDYYSLDWLKSINEAVVSDNYLFFRIGRKKEIEGVLKRNQDTLKCEEILNKDEREIYELEICTYILVDLNDGIIIELAGQFAPSVRSFITMINMYLSKNEKFKNILIRNKNIATSKMIEAFKNGGVKLGKIGYKYNIPNVEILKYLGLDIKQIQALEQLDVLELEVSIKNKPRIPLSKTTEKISYAIKAFEECKNDIKETVFFKGNTKNSGNKKYTFKEEDVTYSIDITNYKIEDKIKLKLTLDEIAEQVYNKIKDRYEGNKEDVLEYIKQ